ncbi:hypothetical protein EVAR_54644_1 [Eumeta japonica]|uniref:Uncharacterized protein n=1 Tax=Eumeta variegata TaxID=151549 RepID=A0A4C1XA51_EUMVA|nr:hypothetical protein EVAR_54644_1 [Eumeta japonica]
MEVRGARQLAIIRLARRARVRRRAAAGADVGGAHRPRRQPKKEKLENGGEVVRPERPNSLNAGKTPRRICYQGDVGGYGDSAVGMGSGAGGAMGAGGGAAGGSEEPLVLSELPEPPIALSEIGPIPPPPMFSSPSPTRHHVLPHPITHQLSDLGFNISNVTSSQRQFALLPTRSAARARGNLFNREVPQEMPAAGPSPCQFQTAAAQTEDPHLVIVPSLFPCLNVVHPRPRDRRRPPRRGLPTACFINHASCGARF